MSSTRRDTDWQAELAPEELGEENGKPVVYLRGLQRLAEEAGLVWSDCDIITPSPNLVQCIYRVRFDDDFQCVGTGDCSAKNTDAPFVNYPTSVAESRAEARALKKALGIRMLAAEEVGMGGGNMDAKPNKPVEESIVVAIDRLCEERGVDKIEVINHAVSDKARASKIFELKQLTVVEGQKAMSFLNSKPPVKKSARTKRKEELLKEKENG